MCLGPELCSRVAREPELQGWLNQTKLDKKMHYPATHEVMSAIDTFYFNHYCQIFRSGAFARANSSMYVGSFGLSCVFYNEDNF